ncbi:hypothetical protein GCM10023205_04830 [Yinghuangia aomiensis]|uniref:Aminoglycoside phosphotransferase domain-containing protein n=1 Tax=Yinghuangia aomiensis TaxID=676205 RepID=A0ABP9GM48_9ACTN
MPDTATTAAGGTWLRGVLAEHYGLPHATEIERFAEGTETDNFTVLVHPTGERYFAKVRRPGYSHDYQARMLALERQARLSTRARLPAPKTLADGQGRLLVPVGGRAVSVQDFVSDAHTSRTVWTSDEAAEVGSVLGQFHRWLAGRPTTDSGGVPVPELWWTKPPSTSIARARQAVDAIRVLQRDGRATDADAVRLDQLRTRVKDIERHHGRLAEGLPPVVRQLVHGDFTRSNLLMRGHRVAAVLDPRIRVLPAAWELGRIAFDPLTVAESDTDAWLATAVAMVTAYRDANPRLVPEQVAACARMALLHALLSTYGVYEHYLDPDPVDQTGVDLYWDRRARMVVSLLEHLDTVEGELAAAAQASPRRTWSNP